MTKQTPIFRMIDQTVFCECPYCGKCPEGRSGLYEIWETGEYIECPECGWHFRRSETQIAFDMIHAGEDIERIIAAYNVQIDEGIIISRDPWEPVDSEWKITAWEFSKGHIYSYFNSAHLPAI